MAGKKADVGVVLCDCGGTLRNQMNYDQLQKSLGELPSVAAVATCSHFCEPKECAKMISALAKKQVRRVVVGACDREIFENSLGDAMDRAKLNQGLLWSVNIREHCGWVHPKSGATTKSRDVLAAAVRRVERAESLKAVKCAVNQNALIYGGGEAAMQTAAALADLGHRVFLVNEESSLGGLPARIPQLYGYLAADPENAKASVQKRIEELHQRVSGEKRIRIMNDSTVKTVDGELGRFTAVIDSETGEREAVSVGAIVLAPGIASSPLVGGLSELICNGESRPRRIAFLMDINAEQGKAVSAQVLSAAEMLASEYEAEVKVYCHNIRVAAAGLENLYRRARQAGAVVVKYASPPKITRKGSGGTISVVEPTIGVEVSEEFDLILSADIIGSADGSNGTARLARLIEDLRAGPDGELQADSVWLLPTKTNRDGVFVVGSSLGTDELRGIQTDALAAAHEIHDLLKKRQITVLDDQAVVDDVKCVLCLTCMRVCPHGAVEIDTEKGAASISTLACKRCGICISHCPAKAIELPRFTEEQLEAEAGSNPQITVFACENSALPAATACGIRGVKYDAKVRLVRIPCAGRLQPREVLRALEAGAQKVIVLACHQENCRYLTGSSRAARRIESLRDTLEKAGFDKNRVIFGELASVEPGKFLSYVKE
jgi:heterodisulfide reductase subunit A-like polyferredoxin/coenzyme F420-reducing hydrogenase delta subunit